MAYHPHADNATEDMVLSIKNDLAFIQALRSPSIAIAETFEGL